MASKPFDVFCNQVCASIRWPPARRLAREELTTLLAQNWYLILEDPTPGCRWFSVTLGRPGDQCTLEITLDEEVPPA